MSIFKRHKDKRALIVPPWSSLVPGRYLDEATLTDWGPPIVINSKRELNIDLGALILFDFAVLDKASTEIVLAQKNATQRKLRETIHILADNGFITYDDLTSRVLNRKDDLLSEVNSEMLRWKHWIPAVQSVVRGWEEIRREYKVIAGSEYNEHCHAPGGIRDYLLAQGKPVTYENIKETEKAVLSSKKSRSHDENEILKAAVKFYIEYAFSNIIARADLNEPFFDWRNLGTVYIEKMRLTGLGKAQNEMRCATEFFSALSIYEPTEAKQLLALRDDKRLSDFRMLVADSAKTGTRLDGQFVQRALDQMARVLQKTTGSGKWITALGAGVGVIEAFTLGAPVISAAAGLATSGAQEAAGAALDKYLTKDMDWLFCLRDAKAC